MKKIFSLLLIPIIAFSQAPTVGQFRYDTTKFLKVGGQTVVKIEGALQSSVQGTVNTTTFTANSIGRSFILGEITTDEIVTFPTLESGRIGTFMFVENRNESVNNWNVSGPVKDGSTYADVLTIPKGIYLFWWNNTNWLKFNSGGGSGSRDTIIFINGPYAEPDQDTLLLKYDDSTILAKTVGTDLPASYKTVTDYKIKWNIAQYVADSATGRNIYNTSDSLQGDRVVTGNLHSLEFNSINPSATMRIFNNDVGTGLYVETATGNALSTYSPNNAGGLFLTNEGTPIFGIKDASSGNTIDPLLVVQRNTYNTPADGIGGSIDFRTQTSLSPLYNSNRIASSWTTVDHATRTSKLDITGTNLGTESVLETLYGSGKKQLTKYGIGTFTGTPAYTLQVDASGNVIEGSVSGSGVTSVATGYGALGGTITTTGTISVDTNVVTSRLRNTKITDSLGAHIRSGKDSLNTLSITAFGDSYTQSQQATSSAYGYINLLGTDFGATINNQSVSARGVWEMAKRANDDAVLANDNTTIVTTLAGLNDVRRNGSATLTVNKIKNATRSTIVNAFKHTYVTATSSTAQSNWATGFTANTVGGKSSAAKYSTTNGGYIEQTFTGTNVGVQMIGNAGVTDNYSDTVVVTIDGIAVDTINTNNQWDNISDGSNDNRRGPVMRVYQGLTNSSHTVRLTNVTSASEIAVLDCWFFLNQPEKCSPVVIGLIPYLNPTGYAVSPSSGSVAATDATNPSIIDVVTEFAKYGYPVSWTYTNSFFSISTGLGADNIHPNDIGYSQLRNAFKHALKNSYRGLFTSSTSTTSSSGAATTPGGSTKAVQYNAGGTFGGATNLNWDNTNGRLLIGGATTGTYDVETERSVNGDLFTSVKNTSTGTGGRAAFYARNSANTPFMAGVTSTGFTPYGALAAGSAFIYSNANPLTIMNDGSNPIVFATGASPATEKIRIPSTGSLLLGTSTDAASSILTMVSTTRGMLMPRMTTAQRNAITAVDGLTLYNTDTKSIDYYNNSAWIQMGNGSITTTTTNATPTGLTYTITDEKSGILEITVVGRETTTAGAVTGKKILRYVKDGGTLTLGTATAVLADEATGTLSTATYSITASSNNVTITVTGVAATTILWRVDVKETSN